MFLKTFTIWLLIYGFEKFVTDSRLDMGMTGSCHERQKPLAPTPQAPVRNRQTRKVANAKVCNRYT